MDKIRIRFKGITEITANDDIALLILVDDAEKVALTIVCDQMMRDQIALRIERKDITRTMLPETLSNILINQFGANLEIVLNDVQEGEYRAMVVNKTTYQPLSMRASDAILLHLISNIPLYATPELMRKQSVPFDKNGTRVALPYNSLSSRMLTKALQKAVEHEEYEVASQLRDELKRRNQSSNS